MPEPGVVEGLGEIDAVRAPRDTRHREPERAKRERLVAGVERHDPRPSAPEHASSLGAADGAHEHAQRRAAGVGAPRLGDGARVVSRGRGASQELRPWDGRDRWGVAGQRRPGGHAGSTGAERAD